MTVLAFVTPLTRRFGTRLPIVAGVGFVRGRAGRHKRFDVAQTG